MLRMVGMLPRPASTGWYDTVRIHDLVDGVLQLLVGGDGVCLCLSLSLPFRGGQPPIVSFFCCHLYHLVNIFFFTVPSYRKTFVLPIAVL